MDWVKRMNLVLDYIEDNLDGDIDENRIDKLSAISKGMFKKIFAALTDMTLSEYIRKRRLTRAAAEIKSTNEKIIDIAVKYGYSSTDAFGLAFKSFHGVPPSDARKTNIKLQSFYPLTFKFTVSVKGGNDMEYRIIENAELKVAQFTDTAETVAVNSARLSASIEEVSACINETSAMVSQNAENVKVAAQLVLDVTKMASEITDKVSRLQTLVNEISAANQEQANAMVQIAIAAAQIEKEMFSNETTSVELSTSAKELKEIIGKLEKIPE